MGKRDDLNSVRGCYSRSHSVSIHRGVKCDAGGLNRVSLHWVSLGAAPHGVNSPPRAVRSLVQKYTLAQIPMWLMLTCGVSIKCLHIHFPRHVAPKLLNWRFHLFECGVTLLERWSAGLNEMSSSSEPPKALLTVGGTSLLL